MECAQKRHGNHKKEVVESVFEDKHTGKNGNSAAEQGDERELSVVLFLSFLIAIFDCFHKEKSEKIDSENIND